MNQVLALILTAAVALPYPTLARRSAARPWLVETRYGPFRRIRS